MRIAIASMLQESNTFSPVYTHYDDFTPVYGKAVLERHRGKLTEMGGFLDVLDRQKVEVAPICAAWAITANRLLRPDFDRLLRQFEAGLAKAKPDALLLAMHGAQTAEGEDDVEGAVLTIARRVLGPDRPIVMSLDLHANITRRMVELSSAIVGYHTYPHIDMFEVGQKSARLMMRILSGQSKPSMAMRKLPLIIPPENSQTHRGPMAKLIHAAQALEASGKAEAVSIFPVQPWMDIAEMGCA
ncbi:MAG: M81 family metallopeptidase, partial [Bryobacterales bacterium]|nr:M81 family metallopeptidase [Bryobacterales bacterium]